MDQDTRRAALTLSKQNIPFISHTENIYPGKHLNESKLHLNHHGIKLFPGSFSKFLVKLNLCQQRKTNLNTSVSQDLGTESHDGETPSRELRNFVENDDPSKIVKYLRLQNVNRLIRAQLNINFVTNKFDSLVFVVNNNSDILMISETKLDSSFFTRQFSIHGFSEPYRFDQLGLIEIVTVVYFIYP